jgi:hypothetical protein
MNTFHKYCPNVFAAKCTDKHEKGDIINLETKYGKEVECEVHNYLGQTRDGLHLYSITRTDGFNSQARAEAKAEKLEGYAANAGKRSTAYWEASHEGRDFLALGEPIKIGHHSERRHRKLIQRNWDRMGKSVAESDKAKEYERRAEYWKDKAAKIDLSMPDSLEFFEFELEKAKKHHQHLKDNPDARRHSMSLQYANKAVKDLEDKVRTAIKLWGDEEDVAQMEQERKDAAEAKASKSTKKTDIVEKHGGFFAFNTQQFNEGYQKIKDKGLLEEGEKACHVGMGLYIPKSKVDSFLIAYGK